MNWEPIVDMGIKMLFAITTGIITAYVVPWLKEKRLYDTVVKMVQAAEKWSKTHDIDKKAYAIQLLTKAGVEVTPTVEDLIESAVQELDIALGKPHKPQLVDANADDIAE